MRHDLQDLQDLNEAENKTWIEYSEHFFSHSDKYDEYFSRIIVPMNACFESEVP